MQVGKHIVNVLYFLRPIAVTMNLVNIQLATAPPIKHRSQVKQSVICKIQVVGRNKKYLIEIIMHLDVLQKHSCLAYTSCANKCNQTGIPFYPVVNVANQIYIGTPNKLL